MAHPYSAVLAAWAHGGIICLTIAVLVCSCNRNEAQREQMAPAPLAEPSAAASPASTPSSPLPTTSARAPMLTDDFRGTAGIVAKQRPGAYPSLLTDVRAARHRHYDRIVFEFSNRVPAYHIEYIDRPVRRCGSGDTTAIRGDGWLEVRLDATDAHTPEGRPTIANRERTLELGVLRELEQTCDFEAVVAWVLGVASPNRYRVTELSDPPRLVIDVHH